MTETATVDFIIDALAGDTIWLHDIQANRYDENRKYLGRGVWRLVPIDAETKQSFIAYYGTKFDRKTGIQRSTGGFSASFQIAGQKEYEAREWSEKHVHNIRRAVESVRDIDKLKQIAAILGYDDTE